MEALEISLGQSTFDLLASRVTLWLHSIVMIGIDADMFLASVVSGREWITTLRRWDKFVIVLQISKTPETTIDDVRKLFSIDDLNTLIDRRWNRDARTGSVRIEENFSQRIEYTYEQRIESFRSKTTIDSPSVLFNFLMRKSTARWLCSLSSCPCFQRTIFERRTWRLKDFRSW